MDASSTIWDYQHTSQLSGFWTESPSFSSHQNLRPRRLQSPSFEHRRTLFPFLGHNSIYFGNPVEWNYKVATKPSEVVTLDDSACCSAQSSSSAVQSGLTISPPVQHIAPMFPIYSEITRVPRDYFIFTIHFAMLPLRVVILDVCLPRRCFLCTSLCITHTLL